MPARSQTASLVLKGSISAVLFALLGALVLVPMAMVVYAAFIDVLPFSGEGEAAWTLDNFRAVLSPEVGAAALNTLVVAAVTWSLLGAGHSGYLNIIFRSLDVPLRIEIRSLAGIALVEGIYYAPYAYIILFGALTLVNPDLEEAAAAHGATLRQTLGIISFPLGRPALVRSAP